MANNSLDVIFGAGSGIGQALIERWYRAGERRVLAVSRSIATVAHSESRPEVEYSPVTTSDTALTALAERLTDAKADVVRLVICNGVLQGDDYRPERALSQLDLTAMRQVFEINPFLPMRILAALTPALKQSVGTRVAVLSARVGSIEDNRLGGWYSYRGSKSALNMMLKCAALELRRVNPAVKILAYHPGTVDTPLQGPSKRGWRRRSSSPRSAPLSTGGVMSRLDVEGDLAYLDWRGEPIPF
ncbi:MAG: short-chain dehydrogenase [Cellvibrionales bacterium]|nr:MAG: short-chain dehydrogenase [Cellvibrionales bacterium]